MAARFRMVACAARLRQHRRMRTAVRLVPAVVLSLAACASAQGPSLAEQKLAAMSDEQKAGQLFVSWIRADAPKEEQQRISAFVEEVGLGGVILSLGSVQQAAALVDDLQRRAAVPLLIAGDFEGGVAFRLLGATQMGNQMLVGASGLSRLAQAMGEVTGREAWALGAPWVLAPVLDVNSNPNNPIINVRSFGESPSLVARLGAAFARGVRSQGAMPCGKHFPGHGDVDSDSHLEMPTVHGSLAELRARELPPFAAAMAEGLESVMSGHLAAPGLGEEPSVPATLSAKILQQVLRQELGFTGLIVTDALDMGGVKNKVEPGEVAVRALLAGADVLLMPPDPHAARSAVLSALGSGRLPKARLDDAVLRILQAKERLSLLKEVPQGAQNDWAEIVGNESAQRVAEEIAQRGLTLVRDERGLVPLAGQEPWLLLTVRDKEILGGGAPEGDAHFLKALMDLGLPMVGEVRISGDSEEAAVAAAAERISQARRVVVALHVKVRSHSGRIGLPPRLGPALQALQGDREVVGVSFGSPYVASELPADSAFLACYASTETVAKAAAKALLGKAAVSGRLTVSIPGVAGAGAGLSMAPGTELPRALPAQEGLDPGLGDDLRALLSKAVADQVTPGAVCMVARRGVVVAEVAVGSESYEEGAAPVGLGTRYDLASLTKVCATLPAVLTLVDAGRLSLEDPVQKWVPDFQGVGKERVLLRHLLAHSAGLPAYERFYRERQGKAAIVRAAAAEGLMYEPGSRVVYSDLGLILAMAVVEAACGEPFEDYVQRAVFVPLGMGTATFAPTGEPALSAPPTEAAPGGGFVRGYVHDENAFAMGGISGHAGLFATAEDVIRLGCAFLLRGRGVWSAQTNRAALSEQAQVGSQRLLGFDTLGPSGMAGPRALPGCFGHTGFTGTSVLCDPVRDLCVVLLTNRVHPTRVNGKIAGLRQSVHDLVFAAADRR